MCRKKLTFPFALLYIVVECEQPWQLNLSANPLLKIQILDYMGVCVCVCLFGCLCVLYRCIKQRSTASFDHLQRHIEA